MSLERTIIGENVKRARESIGFSQASVADFLKVDQSLISKFEKGDRTLRSDILERLANLLGCTVADFEREGGVPEHQLKTAYRASGLTVDDMETIHDIRRISINLSFMSNLAGGDRNEK